MFHVSTIFMRCAFLYLTLFVYLLVFGVTNFMQKFIMFICAADGRTIFMFLLLLFYSVNAFYFDIVSIYMLHLNSMHTVSHVARVCEVCMCECSRTATVLNDDLKIIESLEITQNIGHSLFICWIS